MRSDRRDSSGGSARLALAVAAAGVGLAVTLAAFYPGLLSHDSVMQLGEGRRGQYQIWHPPLMAWLLGRFDAVLPGTGGFCLLNGLLLWSAIAALALACFAGRWSPAIATLALGLSPPVFALSGLIWKDTGMGAALLLAASVLIHAERKRRPELLIAVVPLVAYATALRHNAMIAAFPLCLWAGAVAVRRVSSGSVGQWLAGGAVGLALFALLVAQVGWIERLLVEDPGPPPVQQILVHDLAAISLAEGKLRLPAFMVERAGGLTLEELRPLVTPIDIGPLYWGEGKRVPLVSDPEEVAGLRAAWWQAVRDRPSAYLAHRFEVFGWLIGRHGACDLLPDEPLIPQEPPLWPRFGARMRSILDGLAARGLFHGWIYVALCAAFAAVLCCDPARRSAGLALASSGIGYAAAYLWIGTGCSYRFLWWTALSAMTLLCLGAASILERKRA